MFNFSAAEAVFVIPAASWDSRLAVSQSHSHLFFIQALNLTTLPLKDGRERSRAATEGVPAAEGESRVNACFMQA